VIAAIQAGASIEAGIAAAQARSLLEPDPELDLDGSDAAVKLCAVAGAVFGDAARAAPALAAVRREDVRALDPSLLRERARRGATTRLVARADRAGSLAVAYEEVAAGSPLAAPPDRVVYTYELDAGTRVHTGHGVGFRGTAQALLGDVLAAEVRR
jgi:homoserine dehydrogenase